MRKHKCSGCGKWLEQGKLIGTGTDWNKKDGVAEWCRRCIREIKSSRNAKSIPWKDVKKNLRLKRDEKK